MTVVICNSYYCPSNGLAGVNATGLGALHQRRTLRVTVLIAFSPPVCCLLSFRQFAQCTNLVVAHDGDKVLTIISLISMSPARRAWFIELSLGGEGGCILQAEATAAVHT